MNLHPLFVHFPIALLTVYALMELVRFKKIAGQAYWFYAKAILLMLGGAGALAAYFTGDTAKDTVNTGGFNSPISNFRQVVSIHENFADLSLVIFGILAVGYLVVWLNLEDISRFFSRNSLPVQLWQAVVRLASFFVETKLVILLALLGLICITITGGLGGRMVYGTNADPFLKPMLDWLLGM